MDPNNRDRRYLANLFVKDMRAANLIVTRKGFADEKFFIISGNGLRVWFHPISHKWHDRDKGLNGKGIPSLKQAFGFNG